MLLPPLTQSTLLDSLVNDRVCMGKDRTFSLLENSIYEPLERPLIDLPRGVKGSSTLEKVVEPHISIANPRVASSVVLSPKPPI
jgi:hypothetical protein